jgi:hypothetical protein
MVGHKQRLPSHLHSRALVRARTHNLLHQFCHCWKHWQKASFGIFRSSLLAFHGWETYPLAASFQSRKQPKVTWSEIRRVQLLGDDKNCCTTSGVRLVHYRDAETTASTTFSELHLATSAKLAHRNDSWPSGMNSRCTKPSMTQHYIPEESTLRGCNHTE